MASFRPSFITAAIAVSALAASAAHASTNIVVNPGFETGGALSPWVSAGGWIDATFQTGVLPYDGDRFAASGCITACALSQSLATIAGQSYDLAFAYNPGVQAQFGADIQVFWDGALIGDINSVTNPADPADAWKVYSFTGLVASSGATSLSFSAVQPLVADGLDDVSVTAASVVAGGGPEPATWAMMLLGFSGLGAALRRRRWVAAA